MIKRDILEQIKGFLDRNEYIAVVGPRQAGKTVLFKLLTEYLISGQGINRKNIVNITFEDRKLLKQFTFDPAGFISSFMLGDNSRTYFLIDEFQYAKDGGQKLKLVYDTVQNVKIFITGSSSLDIRAQIGKYMVGRILTFYLYPFSFGEYLRAKDIRMEKIYSKKSGDIRGFIFDGKATGFAGGNDAYFDDMIKHFNDYAVWGGYPAVTLAGPGQRKNTGRHPNKLYLKRHKRLPGNGYRGRNFVACRAPGSPVERYHQLQ